MLKNVIVAGTFDVLHAGHKSLFKRALAEGKCLMVGITSDAFARQRKKREVQPFNKRKRAIEQFLGDQAGRAAFYVLE
ncbi:MAG: adenylyltransferase/cytidyltransferase family protein, partial [Candidatus Micrarchaeota archaeon]